MRQQILQQSLLFSLLFLLILPAQFCTAPQKKFTSKASSNKIIVNRLKQLQIAIKKTKQLAKNHDYNQQIAFLIDLHLASGSNRFFVIDLKKDSILLSGLVTHGSGSAIQNSDSLIFSNIIHSNASSLGMYKIGTRYFGKFGLAFKLHGLSTTNSNAFARAVVLHSHGCVPENEVHPNKICQSWGCPTVAPGFLTKLDTIIQQSEHPILLQIYY
ncbi:MAG: hypothetical protein RLY16_1827 [Bacteroidota bacterium]